MKHVIVIDDKSKANKTFLALAKEFARSNKGIVFDKEAIEEIEDDFLYKEMKRAEKSGILNAVEKATFMKGLKKAVAK